KMPIDLYQLTGSPPCRAVLLTAAAVGVDLNVKNVDLSAGEHLKSEFIKVTYNKIFFKYKYRSIMTYLVNQYGKNDSLYPNDPKKRAMVDQKLYFDMGTLYRSFADYYYPIIFTGVTPEQAKYDKLHEALALLDKFLEGENYVAGKTLTLADITLVVSVSNFPLVDYDLSKYSNILKWFIKIQAEIPNYSDLESVGMKAFADFVEHYKKKT
ncbi:GSTT1 transferase, partial [Acromyrmex charruanus]